MPGELLAKVLGLDITDTTAVAVAALNPDIFTDPSEVPAYLYMSLGSIWLGSAKAADLPKYITAELGGGKTKADGSIVIIERQVMESVLQPMGSRIDITGAEASTVDILIQKPRNTLGGTVKDAELRIRYLLDQTLRGERYISPDLSTRDLSNEPYDKSIRDGLFKCQWRGYMYEPHISQITTRYIVEYIRLFCRTS